MRVQYQAAYVPEQEFRDWEDATQIAVAHVEEECGGRGLRALLVTATIDGASYTPTLTAFVARHRNHLTPRSRARVTDPGSRPTLVYVPDEDMLALAASVARGHVLCAVESSMLRLDGWAAATSAINLDTGEAAKAVPDAVQEDLDHLVFVGNNGYGDTAGKRDARRLLDTLRTSAPSIDGAFLAGYVIGKGLSARGAKRLREMSESKRGR